MSQTSFFTPPRARGSWRPGGRLVRDPDTSRAAAESITLERVSSTQRAVFSVLTLKGHLTDEGLVEAVHAAFPLRRDSASSIRSRRAELVRKGLVEAVPGRLGVTATGRCCHLWRTVERDTSAASDQEGCVD